MATLEKRNETYRIDFRCGGRRYRRSLKTTSERSANASLARLNDNLYRLELGTLVLPDGVDVATFLLSDGRVNGRLTARAPAIRTLKELCGLSLASIPEGSLEESTTEGMEIHARHLCRILGASTDRDASRVAVQPLPRTESVANQWHYWTFKSNSVTMQSQRHFYRTHLHQRIYNIIAT